MLKRNPYNKFKGKLKARKKTIERVGSKATVALDQAFSWFIRLRDTDSTGFGKCITCDTYLHLTEADCGHFMPRVCIPTRWEPNNAALQCRLCNGKENGMRDVFALKLELKEPGRSWRMEVLSKSLLKLNREERYTLAEYYRKEAEELNRLKDHPFVLPWGRS